MRGMLSGALATLMVASLAVAQKMNVSGGLVLQPGQGVQITYTDSSRAGQSVTVHIDNGNPNNPTSVSVTIQLGANGVGSAQWTVPGWHGAAFNAPGVLQDTRVVQCPADDGSDW